MKILLLTFSVLAFLVGFIILGGAKSAIHEIEGFVLFVVSAIFLSGSAIVGAVNGLAEKFGSASSTPMGVLQTTSQGRVASTAGETTVRSWDDVNNSPPI